MFQTERCCVLNIFGCAVKTIVVVFDSHEMKAYPLPGGYSQKNWVGVCGPLPKTLTLFMTKICDFPYPIYDLTKNLIPGPIYDLTLKSIPCFRPALSLFP